MVAKKYTEKKNEARFVAERGGILLPFEMSVGEHDPYNLAAAISEDFRRRKIDAGVSVDPDQKRIYIIRRSIKLW